MWLAAADSGDTSSALVTAVWAFLGVVVTQLAFVIAPIIKAKFERPDRTSISQPAASDTALLMALAKDVGQLDQRANDNDERDDVQDRRHEVSDDRHEAAEGRIDRIEDWITHHDPDWRGNQ